jgi:hypothetical protein
LLEEETGERLTEADQSSQRANRRLFWATYRSGKFERASHSVKSSVRRALAGVKNGRLTLRATAGYCFSPLFGLLRTSPGFTALHPRNLKARGSEGDRGNFPCKTRFSKSLGFKSPLSAIAKIISKYATICALLLVLIITVFIAVVFINIYLRHATRARSQQLFVYRGLICAGTFDGMHRSQRLNYLVSSSDVKFNSSA